LVSAQTDAFLFLLDWTMDWTMDWTKTKTRILDLVLIKLSHKPLECIVYQSTLCFHRFNLWDAADLYCFPVLRTAT